MAGRSEAEVKEGAAAPFSFRCPYHDASIALRRPRACYIAQRAPSGVGRRRNDGVTIAFRKVLTNRGAAPVSQTAHARYNASTCGESMRTGLVTEPLFQIDLRHGR